MASNGDPTVVLCFLFFLIVTMTYVEHKHNWEHSHRNAEDRADVEHQLRMAREAEAHKIRLQREKESHEASNAFWHKVESQHIPRVFNLLELALMGAGIIIVVVLIAWGAYLLLKRFIEKQKLKNEMEMQKHQMSHDALLRDKELEQRKALKERELQQQLAINEREMQLEAERLDQQRYNDERKYRLELGKMYVEACKGAASSGQLHEMRGALNNMTQLMLLADQPTSSVESITQLAIMANEQSAHIQSTSKPRRRQRGRGSASSHQSFDSSKPDARSSKSYRSKGKGKSRHSEPMQS
mmetsp:Transcript_139379/g.245896  ORF Transcript_139379/g.245896 Transcript_139379/m.245896 type:complete len:298 (+) Transcript_139379:45-938(+)